MYCQRKQYGGYDKHYDHQQRPLAHYIMLFIVDEMLKCAALVNLDTKPDDRQRRCKCWKPPHERPYNRPHRQGVESLGDGVIVCIRHKNDLMASKASAGSVADDLALQTLTMA